MVHAGEGRLQKCLSTLIDLIVLTPSAGMLMPTLIVNAGKRASHLFVDFFTVSIAQS
jgi:hypothetical protein